MSCDNDDDDTADHVYKAEALACLYAVLSSRIMSCCYSFRVQI